MNRTANLHRLRTEIFDVCIIGGGATGAGCALDAASRGLTTALIERDDFSAATSGTSTKLVHGGVRYLEQAFKNFDHRQLSLVRKALHERRTLLQIAPHLVHSLALVTPCANLFEGLYYTIGLKLYDLLAGSRRMQASRWLSRKEARRLFPAFNEQQLHSAVLYYDGQFDDVRLNLALVKTAAEQGAAVANHLRALAFETDPQKRILAVVVEDRLTGEQFSIRARTFVNATGTYADFLRQEANKAQPERMQASKGAHVVLPANALPMGQAALLVPKTADGRVLFAIPWRENWLIGTTDTPADPKETPYLLPDEAEYLVNHVNHFLRTPISVRQVRGGFAGLRPLLKANPDEETRNLVRDHEVEVDKTSGLISIMGGKWTTYRLMAQETVDECCRQINTNPPSRTDTLSLAGSQGFTEAFRSQFAEAYPELGQDVVAHLVNTYGVESEAIAKLFAEEPTWSERLVAGHPFIRAEVVYAIRYEMAQTIDDVLMRRIRLGLVDWEATLEAVEPVVRLMTSELNWTVDQREEARSQFQTHIETLMDRAGVSVSKPQTS